MQPQTNAEIFADVRKGCEIHQRDADAVPDGVYVIMWKDLPLYMDGKGIMGHSICGAMDKETKRVWFTRSLDCAANKVRDFTATVARTAPESVKEILFMRSEDMKAIVTKANEGILAHLAGLEAKWANS